MKIVVTGPLGHIGSKLIRDIPSVFPGADIVMIDNLSTQRYCSLFDLPSEGKYSFFEEDILTCDLVERFKDADAVIHLAAITDAEKSFDDKTRFEKIIFNGTKRVAKACIKAKCPLIMISTTSVYGRQVDLVREDTPVKDLRPQSPYAIAKLKAELFLHEAGLKRGLNFIILRFGTIFGPSPGMRFHTAINKFCWQAVLRHPMTIWKTAIDQKRPYLYLEDGVGSILFVIENKLFDNNIYNVLTENATVKDIIDIISFKIKDIETVYVESPIMNQLSYEVSNANFIGKGFVFKGTLKKGIFEIIDMLITSNNIPCD